MSSARTVSIRSGRHLEMALEQWTAQLGRENVILDPAALRGAETATFGTSVTVPAIVRPGNREEVQQVLRIANEWRIPVYPVSGGCNWGYGSRVPGASGCVLLDLGRMNRILDFSEDLAYITVEPGVTQQQVYAFLQERKSGLWMDATGASPQASLVGNAVERGFGHQHARQGSPDALGSARDQLISGDNSQCCGAVDLSSEMAPRLEPSFLSFSQGQNTRTVAIRPRDRLTTAVSRFMGHRIAAAKKVREQFPANYFAHRFYPELFVKQGLFSQPVQEEYRALLDAHPDHLTYLAPYPHVEGYQHTPAIKLLDRILERQPDDARARWVLQIALGTQDDRDR